MTGTVEKGLTTEQRTVKQLGERIARRWRAFGYEDALLSAEGIGIRTGLGVLEELLSPSKCRGNNLHCEDGVDIRDGAICPRCEEHRQDRRPAGSEPAGHPEVDSPKETYTPPAYVPAPREYPEGEDGVEAFSGDVDLDKLMRDVIRDRPRLPR
ncbi:hypothetical protein ACFQ0X_43790 [Streptomyces rectiviolaceus]|uniref:hypothetical protein n=1 Tax=Streptomyces rectiviolaceus TaxID=332591 RepID=UPI00362778C3